MKFFRSPYAVDRNLPLKKLGISVGVVLAVLLVVYTVASSLVDASKLKNLAQGQVKQLTGRDLMVKGPASATLFPSPQLTLTNVELVAPEEGAPGPVLRAENLVVHVTWGSLFSTPALSKIVLYSPVLELQKTPEGDITWGWLGVLPAGMEAASAKGFALELHNGRIAYLNQATEASGRVENINLVYAYNEGTANLGGSLSYKGRNFQAAASQNGPQIALRLWQNDKTYLDFKGEKVAGDAMLIKGTLDGKAADMAEWLRAPTVEIPTSAPPTYPASLNAQLSWNGSELALTEMVLETEGSAGKGAASITFGDVPAISTELAFSRLKLDPAMVMALFATRPDAATVPGSYQQASASTLPRNIRANASITAEDVFLGTTHFPSATLTASLAEATLQVDRLSAAMPGESQIVLTGAVTDTTRGPRFQGVAELSGKELHTLLTSFEPAAAQLPEKGFGEFSLKGNFFFSSEQLRLSEAELRLDALALVGGLVTYFEATPRIEAEVSLSGTNLDYFRDSWRQQAATKNEFIFKINSSVDFSWLRQLKPIIDLKINLNQFTFLEHQGSSASFRLYAKQNEFGLYNLEMNYPDGILKGKLKVNVTSEQPFIDLELEAPWLDTSYFAHNPETEAAPLIRTDNAENRWSKEFFDFSWMIGVTGQFKLSVEKMVHKSHALSKFMIESTLTGEQLQFKKLNFDYLGGRIESAGTLIGGKVPGLSASFTVYNADLAQIIHIFSPIEKLSGRASLSGTIVTSGINFLSWVEQAEAKIVMAGRGIRAQGFNVQGVIDGVNGARSVAQVVENVGRSLPSGATDFSIDGNINISKGIVRTPGMAMSAGRVVASLNGELQLIAWRMVLNMMFQFPMLQSETVPTLAVDVVGTPENYSFKFDTSSLEAYVAKRIVGR